MKRVNKMLPIIKKIMVLISLFVLTACSLSHRETENETNSPVEEEANTKNKETTSELNEVEKEVSSEEEKEETDQDNEAQNISTTEELKTNVKVNDFQWLYDELNGKSFIFSSGVGAWRTHFTFTNDGQFSGTYSDANGPEVDVSEFIGQFNINQKIDEYTYQLELDKFQVTSETGKKEKDGEMTITYVEEPHGFQSGSNTFELYLPYKSKNEVSEEYLSWVYGQANNEHDFLNSFGLYNTTYQFGMEELLE